LLAHCPNPRTARRISPMDFLIRFSPWIAYSVVASAVSWQAGLGAGLVVTLLVVGYALRSHSLDVLTIGGLVYFAAMLVASPWLGAGVHAYTQAISHGWLTLLMWASLALGAPFTMTFAKRETSPDVWASARFRQVNVVITTIWAGCFTVAAAVLIVLAASRVDQGATLTQVASIVVPLVMMRIYLVGVRKNLPAGT
jgi:hypothetical protein